MKVEREVTETERLLIEYGTVLLNQLEHCVTTDEKARCERRIAIEYAEKIELWLKEAHP